MLARTYTREGYAPVMLLIAYSGAQDGTIYQYIAQRFAIRPVASRSGRSPEPHFGHVRARAWRLRGGRWLQKGDVRYEQLIYLTSWQPFSAAMVGTASSRGGGKLWAASFPTASSCGYLASDQATRFLCWIASHRTWSDLWGRVCGKCCWGRGQNRAKGNGNAYEQGGGGALCGISGISRGRAKKVGGQVVAVVNGQEITQGEVNAELNGQQLPAGADRKKMMSEIVQQIVSRKLLVDKAKQQGLEQLSLPI